MLFFLKMYRKTTKNGQPHAHQKKTMGVMSLTACITGYLKSDSRLKFKIIPGISDNGFATGTNRFGIGIRGAGPA